MAWIREKLPLLLRWGLPLFVFLLPWQTRYIFAEYSTEFPLYGDASLYATDLFFLILLAVWLFWMISGGRWRQYKTHSHKISGAFEILLLLAALSIIWSPDRSVSALAWLRLLQASILVLMLATAPIRRQDLIIAFIGAGVVQSLFATTQFLTQTVWASKWLGMSAQSAARLGASVIEQDGLRWLRAYGTLPHPNILGGWMVMSALSAAYLYLDAYHRLANAFQPALQKTVAASFASFILIFIGLLFTFSRTAWMGFAAGMAVILLLMLRPANCQEKTFLAIAGAKLVFAGILFVALLNAFFGNLWLTRVQGEGRLAEQSGLERENLILQAQEVIQASGLKGVGIGAYSGAIMALDKNLPIYKYQPVHNVWLLAFAELGLAGLALLFLWMTCWYVFVKSLFLGVFSREKILPYALILAAGLMAYFDHFWWTLPVGLFLAATLLGLLLRREKSAE